MKVTLKQFRDGKMGLAGWEKRQICKRVLFHVLPYRV